MTKMWSFNLPNGGTDFVTLDWAYVPYVEELRAWVLENWDDDQDEKENWRRFYAAAERFVENESKPKHPIDWVLGKVEDHMDEPD